MGKCEQLDLEVDVHYVLYLFLYLLYRLQRRQMPKDNQKI